MTKILLALLVFGIQQWRLTSETDSDEGQTVETKVIVISGDKGGEGCCVGLSTEDCVVLAGDSDGAARSFVFVTTDDDGNGKQIRKRIRIQHKLHGDGDDEDSGWLGVTIGEVSKVVSSQLDLDGRGITILSVIPDSPAERAGLQSHDVLLSVDGTDITGAVGEGVKIIAAHKPGDEVEIVVLRDGNENTLTAVLGSRAEMPAFRWKFGVPPLAELDEQITTTGGMIHFGPGGTWEFKDLGDLSLIEGLPDHIMKFLPSSGNSSIKVWHTGEGKSVQCSRIIGDGSSLSIEHEDGGEIVVTRTDQQGNETVEAYADAEDLLAGDPEAFEFYDKSGESIIVKLELKGLADLEDIDIDLDIDGLKEHILNWEANVGEGVAEALKTYGIHLNDFREGLNKFKSGHGVHALAFGPGGAAFIGKPRQTFEVRSDGTIEVRLRKGDSELLRTFEDEYDLQRRRPDLYDKYMELTSAEEDEVE